MGRLGKTQHFSCLSVEFLPSTLSKKWASWDPASFLRALMSRANAKNQLCTRCGAKPSLSLLFLQLQCLYGLWALLSQIFSHQHSWKYNELKSRCMFRKKLAKKKNLTYFDSQVTVIRKRSFCVDQSCQCWNRGFKTKRQVETVFFVSSFFCLLTTSFVHLSPLRP